MTIDTASRLERTPKLGTIRYIDQAKVLAALAVVRRGDVEIAVSTGGTSPALAARLRRRISAVVGPEYARLAALLSRTRSEIRGRVRNERDRKELHYRILDSDIISLLRNNDNAAAERRLKEIVEEFLLPEKTL